MNKRIKKKRSLEIKVAGLVGITNLLQSVWVIQRGRIQRLENLNNAQGEQIEALESQIGDLKRLVKQNAEATNNRLDDQDGKIKKVADDLTIKTAKKGFFKR